MHFNSKVFDIIQSLIAIFSLCSMVGVYICSEKKNKKAMTIRGNEKTIKSFIGAFLFSIKETMKCLQKDVVFPTSDETHWLILDLLYSKKDSDFVSLRQDADLLLKQWTKLKTLRNLHSLDEEVRKYYGMKAPEPLLNDFEKRK